MKSRIYFIIWSLDSVKQNYSQINIPNSIIRTIINLINESEIYDIKNTIYNNLYGTQSSINKTFNQLINLYDINGALDNILRENTLNNQYFNNIITEYITRYINNYKFIITDNEYKKYIINTYKYLFTKLYDELIMDAYNLYRIRNENI